MALAGDGADVDADLGLVGHRVDVEAAVHPADIERRRAHDGVRRDVEAEFLELGDGARGLVDGVDALVGHGAVGRHAARHGLEPERALVAAHGIVLGWLGDDERAGLARHAAAGEHEGAFAAGLLAGGDVKDDAGRAGEPGREIDGSSDEGGDAGLHVGGAAAPDAAVLHLGGMRIDGPRLQAKRDGVGVAGKGERRLGGTAADARDQIGTAIGEIDGSRRRSRRG